MDEVEEAVKDRNGRSPKDRLTVVGVGASAGGLKALRSFFESLPADSGMAFVVVTHLAPDQESLLPDLLQRYTEMPVRQVQALLAVEPNHVYVIPPGCRILMTDTHINTDPFDEPRGRRTPVDDFFRSLAAAHRNSVVVILSGSGTDGAVGVKAIKEHGGLLLVQEPNEAEFDGMPSAAIATGLADLVLPAAELAQKLLAYSRNDFGGFLDSEYMSQKNLKVLQRILTQVQFQTGHDFSQYRPGTLLQRIVRRMKLHSIGILEDYLQFLRNNEAEIWTLFNDLLVGITTFFRYPKTWEALAEQVVPRLFAGKDGDDTIRVWSIGCATGEEAYSLAILLFEEADRRRTENPYTGWPNRGGVQAATQQALQIKVFASDLDESALHRARQGLYPEVIEADLSQERLERFFEKEGIYYRIRPELREAVLFASHSVLYDPPFSRLDLISSRNLLTHLQQPLRRSVMEIFFYALNPGGYLFLDNLDSAEVSSDLFTTVDPINRIYAAHLRPERRRPMPELPFTTFRPAGPSIPAVARPVRTAGQRHQEALEALAPPSLLVDEDFQVLHLSESAGRYLHLRPGTIKSNLLDLVRPELRQPLKMLLPPVLGENKSALTPPVLVNFDGVFRQVVISVQPFQNVIRSHNSDHKEPMALVFFLEDEAAFYRRLFGYSPMVAGDFEEGGWPPQSDQMEKSVGEAVWNEQLRVANEKLSSILAEHGATVDELQRRREELYSTNEELRIINEELDQKVAALSGANSDLENLMAATAIPTLFLDRNFNILRYTPAAGRLFSLQPHDLGRPLSELANVLLYEAMLADAEGVLETLVPREREVQDGDGRWLLIRHHPYLAAKNRIDGVVLTFVDVTELKQTEIELRESERLVVQEVMALRRLHQMTGKVVTATEMQEALDEILDTGIDLLQADSGAIQLLDRSRQVLFIAAHRNFDPAIVEMYKEIGVDNLNVSGRVLRFGRRFLIEDITAESPEEPYVETMLKLGIKALQATPLINHQGELIGVLSNQFFQPRAFLERDEQWLDLLAYHAANLVERLQVEERLEQRVRHRTVQVRRLASELIAAEQTVRQRLAQTLHDNLQQTLYAAKVQLQFMIDAVGEVEEVVKLKILADQSLKITRQLTVELSPPILEQEGLLDALKWLAEHMKDLYELHVTVQSADHPATATKEERILLYQIVRELLFNIVKHAGVKEAVVRLERSGDNLVVIVSDEGKGFDVMSTLAKSSASFGLRSIDERLQLFDGRAEIESQPGRGTQVRLFLPSSTNHDIIPA